MPDLNAVLHEHLVAPGVAPGATACVARRGPDGWAYVVGASGMRSALRPDPVLADAIYDLASVTKPIVCVCLARLHDRGLLSLDDTLAEALPWLAGSFAGPASLESLLAHRAGLEAHVELFDAHAPSRRTDRRAALVRAANAARAECREGPPSEGFPALYSDLGYLLLGAAIEHVTGQALDDVVAQELAALGLSEIASARLWAERLRGAERNFETRAVPTEVVDYRGGEVLGQVHDDNAFAIAGAGLCGHAGLFATARALARFGAVVVDLATRTSQALEPTTAARLFRPRPGTTLRAGFDGKSGSGSSVGTLLGPTTVGHLGFTGTSLWCDPQSCWLVAVLCNRVSPTRVNPRITRARPELHDALLRAAGFA